MKINIFSKKTNFHFYTYFINFTSHFHLITDMNLSFSPSQTPKGQTTLGRIVKQSGFLKIHVSRDYSESFNGFPVVARSLNENRKFTFIPLYLAGNVTMIGTVPTAYIAVLTQRHSYATIHIGIFNNKKHPSVWGFLSQNHGQCGSDGVYGNRPSRGKFGSPCVFPHGRWSPRSRDLGARSSSMFSTRHPIPFLPLSLCLCIPQAGINPPPPLFYPPSAPRPPATQRSSRRAALDQPSIHRAFKLVCHF